MPEAAETPILALWLPVVVAAAVTMVLSTLAWTALPHHKPDMQQHPEADDFAAQIKDRATPPGVYYFPAYGTPKEPGPHMKAGPWGTINIYPSAPNVGRNIGLTLLALLVIAVFVGYLTGQACSPGADASRVFQIAMTNAVLCHVFGGALNGIWFGKRLRFFITDAIDGLVYSAATGACFALLWPAAQPAIDTIAAAT
ncbi:MAG: hypothetical protein AAFR96_08865 [Planctomycetota bacterium]